MDCMHYDEEKKQCINPYCFYKGMDCPVKVYPEMCKMYDCKTKELIQDLRNCAEGDCGDCRLRSKARCHKSLLGTAADELERLMKELPST